MDNNLSDKLKNLPNSAGVYFHKNSKNEIIYIGKAANLRNRVRSYFQNINNHNIKTRSLISEIYTTDWIEVETEIDALFLESEMIKRYKPKFNILLRDDKSSTYVRIGWRDKIPNVSFTKLPMDDGAEYFGPFYANNSIKKSLRLIRKVFPFYDSPKLPLRNNLNSQIGLTPGLENLEVNSFEFDKKMKEYKKNLRNLAFYLKGERSKVQEEIESEMKIEAFNERFENAIEKRNQLRYLKELGKQVVFSREEFMDISKDYALSKLTEILSLENIPRRIECFDISHIGGQHAVASMVVFTNGLSNKSEYRKFKISISKNDDIANMKEVLKRRFSKNNQKWTRPDLIILDGGKNQLIAGIEVLEEVGLNQKIPILSIAKREEEMIISSRNSAINIEWFLKRVDGRMIIRDGDFIMSNLHGQKHSRGHARNLLGESNSEFSDLTKLFQRIRDESHRFAITYHSTLRSRSYKKSQLEQISGVGKKTRAKLMKEFKSLSKIKSASKEEISKVVGEKMADRIKNNL